MSIGDKINALKLPLLSASKSAEEQERLLKLYWNRAELKKELASLDDQLYQLRDRLKQQEAATQRAVDERESLETLLGNPELGFGALVHFQLNGLWRACRAQLEQFASELRRQQEDRERKRQLVEFHQERQSRTQLAAERIAEAEEALRVEEETLAGLRARLKAATGFWNYFRRRRLTDQIARQMPQANGARRYLDDMQEAKRTIEKEPWPEFGGLSLEGRRAINNAVIAYTQLLYARLAESGLALHARQSRVKSVHESNYGSRAECEALMSEIAAGAAIVKSQKDIAGEIRTRTEAIKNAATYRHPEDTVPDPGSLPSAFLGRGVPVREPNVLIDDYWDVYATLLR
ncbi:MAG TPA: hypothetical protein VMT92_02965 [Steroidobacteraceae bacterium]|nr:hypothetical protein [Steroidobacteraceae bacterium]